MGCFTGAKIVDCDTKYHIETIYQHLLKGENDDAWYILNEEKLEAYFSDIYFKVRNLYNCKKFIIRMCKNKEIFEFVVQDSIEHSNYRLLGGLYVRFPLFKDEITHIFQTMLNKIISKNLFEFYFTCVEFFSGCSDLNLDIVYVFDLLLKFYNKEDIANYIGILFKYLKNKINCKIDIAEICARLIKNNNIYIARIINTENSKY